MFVLQDGRFPLHIALKHNICNEAVVRLLLESQPEAAKVADKVSVAGC